MGLVTNEETFIKNCVFKGAGFLDKNACLSFLDKVLAARNIDDSLFLSEEAYRAAPKYNQHKGVNPIDGRNLVERFDLSFIEENKGFQELMGNVLGKNYIISRKKFVVGVPESIMPNWLLEETKDFLTPNLGAYIKPEFRDITYFHGIDFHQDIVDYPKQRPDFITFYVYLDDTDENSSPLYVIPETHKFGATTFPHDLEYMKEESKIKYSDRRGDSGIFSYEMLIGPSGSVYFWHPFILHGTKPHLHSKPRISLRYIIWKDPHCGDCLLETINKRLDRPQWLDETRLDLNANGDSTIKGNVINKNNF